MATVNRVFDKRNHKKIKNQFINVLLFWHLIEQSSIKNRLKKDFMKYDGYSYDYFLLYHFSGEVELGEEFYLFIYLLSNNTPHFRISSFFLVYSQSHVPHFSVT